MYIFLGIAGFAGYVLLGIVAHGVYAMLEKHLDAYLDFAFRDIPESPSAPSKPMSEGDKWWLRWFCFWAWPFPTLFVLALLISSTVLILLFRLPTLYVKWIRSKPWKGWYERWSDWYRTDRIVEKKPPRPGRDYWF